MKTGLNPVVEKIVEKKIGKIASLDLLYGGSDRKFVRITGKRGSLVLLEDADSRMLDNYLLIGSYRRSCTGNIRPSLGIQYHPHGRPWR